jgi:pimeloyl-ACP methyl ester carboxylesterase
MTSSAAPTQSRFDVDGQIFRVRSTKNVHGSNPRVFVLVHGIGTSHRYFERLHALLGVDADVHSVDLPGFGGMPKPRHAPSVPDMATALGVVLDRLGIRNAVLVGHSMGAQWVVELGIMRPDVASAVVGIGPVVDDRHRTLAAQSSALLVDILGEPPNLNAMVFSDYLRCGVLWFLREARQMLAYPIEDRVPELGVPLLILRGGNDPIASLEWCRRLTRRAAHGRLVIVPGHRHVVQFTAARAVGSAIVDFLDRAPLAPPGP